MSYDEGESDSISLGGRIGKNFMIEVGVCRPSV